MLDVSWIIIKVNGLFGLEKEEASKIELQPKRQDMRKMLHGNFFLTKLVHQ